MATKSKRLTLLSNAEEFALLRSARLRRRATVGVSVAVRSGTVARVQPSRPARAGLLCPADRLLQGQARFLPLRLERCRGRLRFRPDPLLHRPGVRAAPYHQT